MDKSKLDKITEYLIDRIFRTYIYYCQDNNDYMLWLLNIIASLHNELYKEVTGDYYDYMFHWSNKAGYDNIKDNYFKDGYFNEH